MRLFIAGLLAVVCSIADARYCNSPSCAMCNRIFGYMPGYGPNRQSQLNVWRTVQPKPKPSVASVVEKLDSTPFEAVEAMLGFLSPTPDQVLYDIGCGDGRILIAACSNYGCRAVGIEVNHETAELARRNVKAAGLEDKIRIYEGDGARVIDVSKIDFLTMYLYPETMRKLNVLLSRLHPKTEVISYQHEIPSMESSVYKCTDGEIEHTFYKVDSKAPIFKPVQSEGEVILYVGPQCPPCELAKERDVPRFKTANIKIRITDKHAFETPSYWVRKGTKSKFVKGYLPYEKIVEILQAL